MFQFSYIFTDDTGIHKATTSLQQTSGDLYLLQCYSSWSQDNWNNPIYSLSDNSKTCWGVILDLWHDISVNCIYNCWKVKTKSNLHFPWRILYYSPNHWPVLYLTLVANTKWFINCICSLNISFQLFQAYMLFFH